MSAPLRTPSVSRRELIRSVLEPSAAIAVGYGTTVVETKSGDEFPGIIKQVTDAWIELMGADGKTNRVLYLVSRLVCVGELIFILAPLIAFSQGLEHIITMGNAINPWLQALHILGWLA